MDLGFGKGSNCFPLHPGKMFSPPLVCRPTNHGYLFIDRIRHLPHCQDEPSKYVYSLTNHQFALISESVVRALLSARVILLP